MPEDDGNRPSAAASLRLPPTFITDHCVRTLASQGAMTLGELARHWRVPGDVATEIIESARHAGLIESENARTNIETGQRWRLSGPGQTRVESARTRTWYAGPMPLSLQEFQASFAEGCRTRVDTSMFRSALAPFHLDEAVVAECGQAIAARTPLLLAGCAHDEQPAIAEALATAFQGSVKLPQAIFAAGAVLRVIDGRHHHPVRSEERVSEGALRSKETFAPWLEIEPPALTLTGGLVLSDVIPPFDDDARFYVVPAPMAASGGLLTVCNAGNSEREALERLARHWLVPAAGSGGIVLLRTGERIEVPWTASVVIFAAPSEVPDALATAVPYQVDAAALEGQALRLFLTDRLTDAGLFTPAAIDGIARLLERAGIAARQPAAAMARYLRDRSAYEGGSFTLTDDAMADALRFAGSPAGRPDLSQAA